MFRFRRVGTVKVYLRELTTQIYSGLVLELIKNAGNSFGHDPALYPKANGQKLTTKPFLADIEIHRAYISVCCRVCGRVAFSNCIINAEINRRKWLII